MCMYRMVFNYQAREQIEIQEIKRLIYKRVCGCVCVCDVVITQISKLKINIVLYLSIVFRILKSSNQVLSGHDIIFCPRHHQHIAFSEHGCSKYLYDNKLLLYNAAPKTVIHSIGKENKKYFFFGYSPATTSPVMCTHPSSREACSLECRFSIFQQPFAYRKYGQLKVTLALSR